MRRYWVQNLSGPGVSHDDDGDGWFSRANLFLALYAEVEAQGRGEGHATDAAESLFGSRLAGVPYPYPYPYHYPYPYPTPTSTPTPNPNQDGSPELLWGVPLTLPLTLSPKPNPKP